ncbi:type II toxin-antitoxin system ParD family antitoxin [Nonomuraea sp. NPDC049400]|uniref:type II toxin-antitoxin system ParD family antitoxin n=1 Tax=Nonomuraea sp. NPDC049400 TaxID=3364352 RepID=UPI0037992D81
MSTKPITITVDESLHAYVQEQVEAGRVRSVSAYFNHAARHQMETERHADLAWRAAVEKARQDPAVVERAQRRARKAQEILNGR